MHIYLLRRDDRENDANDCELLRMRGYRVITSHDVRNFGNDPDELRRIQCSTILNCCPTHMRAVVIHESVPIEEALDMAAFCRVIGTPCIRYEELPALAPSDRSLLGTDQEHTTRSLGDRLRAALRSLLHWEARANAVIGDALKNPVSRRATPKPYREDPHTSTTG